MIDLEYGQQVRQRTDASVVEVDSNEFAAAMSGDAEAFRSLTERFTRELHVHCYRMLGSFHDAEDAVQETLLRAWRHRATFEHRSSLRAWLYRIATNVCLAQRRRPHQDVPLLPPAIAAAAARSTEPPITLTPYADVLLDELIALADPAAEIELRESVQLAFLAAVQLLPPRQRAVLILRDVVGFSAAAVAEMLESTTASVNSALNRARSTLELQRVAGRLHTGRTPPPDDVAEHLANRYAEAWQARDIPGLVGLLKRDVVLTMPPLPLRYTGRESVASFFAALPLAGPDVFRVLPTRANRQPARAAYRRLGDSPTYRAWGIWVLTMDVDAIAEVTAFVDPDLLPKFGLPAELPG